MSKFKVGDYILFSEGRINLIGKVVDIENDGILSTVFSTPLDIFHDLGGLCQDKYGFWAHPEYATLVVADTKINRVLYPDYKPKEGFLIAR
jgi:hypothetical protein